MNQVFMIDHRNYSTTIAKNVMVLAPLKMFEKSIIMPTRGDTVLI